jgi:tRNA modification GTPase
MVMQSRNDQHPIIAIATASGRGAVGIIRVSGRRLEPLIALICGRRLTPRVATYLPFLDNSGEAIDQGLALYFPAPHSFTGEDVLELQAHGGPIVLQILLARCLEAASQLDPLSQLPLLANLRLAEPGEFTERAFLNNKIDLAQAEAIADLIDASTQAAARSASRSLSGAFSDEVNALRNGLIHLQMLVEATLDFPEEDIDFLQQADASGQLLRLHTQLQTIMQHTRQGALLREGIKVVIAGQPNAGKSSLLNALAGAELAIVTPIAGTTRDKVQQTIQIEGVPLHIIDTAGLRDSTDEVERIGIERAWAAMSSADTVLFLHDASHADNPVYQQAEHDIEQHLSKKVPISVQVVDVWNKQDLCVQRPELINTPACSKQRPQILLSARTGAGLQDLRQLLLRMAGWQSTSEGVYIARTRHVQALQNVAGHLENARLHLHTKEPALDILAEELRLAQNALGSITGVFSSDDLLGVIFSSFCIGK